MGEIYEERAGQNSRRIPSVSGYVKPQRATYDFALSLTQPGDTNSIIMMLHAEPGSLKRQRGAPLVSSFVVGSPTVAARSYGAVSREAALMIPMQTVSSVPVVIKLSV
ncbi:hypothetical protein TNCV_2367341 [Trichonephila clavipes]|nr:hypothetical protein TNCV_2367341 [Trichonephila clavipes]